MAPQGRGVSPHVLLGLLESRLALLRSGCPQSLGTQPGINRLQSVQLTPKPSADLHRHSLFWSGRGKISAPGVVSWEENVPLQQVRKPGGFFDEAPSKSYACLLF